MIVNIKLTSLQRQQSHFYIILWEETRAIKRCWNNENAVISKSYCKQDRQCTCNLPIRHVHAAIVAVEKYYILWVCLFSIRYLARNANASCSHLWPAWLYSIFPRYKRQDFRKYL